MGKKLATFLLCMGVLFVSKNSISAAIPERNTVITDQGYSVEVNFSEQAKDQLSDEEILAIVNDVTEDSVITIHEVGKNEEPTQDERLVIIPNFQIDSKKSYTGSNIVMKDEFVISVARGQVTTLSHSFTSSAELSITGSYFHLGDLGLKSSFSYTISVSHQFSGPDSNYYNSREFRIKILGDSGTYTQTKKRLTGELVDTKTGTFKEPKSYAIYSNDKKY